MCSKSKHTELVESSQHCIYKPNEERTHIHSKNMIIEANLSLR